MCARGGVHGTIVTCAWRECHRLFVVCEHCEQGQKYCGPSCRAASRKDQEQRARLRYSRSYKGKRKTSIRNRAYRLRLTERRMANLFGNCETDHTSSQDRTPEINGLDHERAISDSPVGAKEGPHHDELSTDPTCVRAPTTTEEALLHAGHRKPGVAPTPRAEPALRYCRLCGTRVRWLVDRETLGQRVKARRNAVERSCKRAPRQSTGPPTWNRPRTSRH